MVGEAVSFVIDPGKIFFIGNGNSTSGIAAWMAMVDPLVIKKMQIHSENR